MKRIFALLGTCCLLAGCGSVGQSVQQRVNTECSMQISGLDFQLEISAPGEDQNVDSLIMHVTMPADAYGMENVEEVVTDETKDQLIETFSTVYSVPKENIQIRTENNELLLDMEMNDESIRKAFSLDEETSLVFKELKETLKNVEQASCS